MNVILNAIMQCDADCIPADKLTALIPFRGKKQMPILAIWIRCYSHLDMEKRDSFLKDLCAKGLDLNSTYTIVCGEDDCTYTVNALSQAIGVSWCDPTLQHRYNPNCLLALLDAGADPKAQFWYEPSDAAQSDKLEGSILMLTLRSGKLTSARILLERGARFNQETDDAPLANACACSFDISTVIHLFGEFFERGQITLRDVQTPWKGENTLQMYARLHAVKDINADLEVLVRRFGLDPHDGAVRIAQEAAAVCRRMQMYDRDLEHAKVAKALAEM